MRKWGSGCAMVVGTVIGIWVVASAILVQQSRPARDAAERALKERLEQPVPPPDDADIPPRPAVAEALRDAEGMLPEDMQAKWTEALERIEGLFDFEHPSEAQLMWRDLRLSYRTPVPWSEERRAALEELLRQYDDVVSTLIELANLGVPPPITIVDWETGERVDVALTTSFDCVCLLNVLSYVEARGGDIHHAFESLQGAIRLLACISYGLEVAAHPEFDAAAEEVLRNGALSSPELAQLEPAFSYIARRGAFEDSVINTGRALADPAWRQTWLRQHSLRGRATTLVQSTLFAPWYHESEQVAYESAARLPDLASLPYYRIRDELASIEREVEPRWYSTRLLRFVRSDIQLHFLCQARWEARRDLVRLALAIEEHVQAAGTYPDSLDAVATAFEEGAPLDVFTGQAYRYRRTEDGFVLSSSGKDGIDNGGEGDDVAVRFWR